MSEFFEEFGMTCIEFMIMGIMVRIMFWLLGVIETLPV